MEIACFDDDDDDVDMNSSCEAVSQILLSLESAAFGAPQNKLPLPDLGAVDCENVLYSYASQSTVDDSSQRRAVSTERMHVTDSDGGGDTVDDTQYVERCIALPVGPAESCDLTTDSDCDLHGVLLSTRNSPSLLDNSEPCWQNMRSSRDIETADADEKQTTENVGQSDIATLHPVSARMSDNRLELVSSPDNHHVQPCDSVVSSNSASDTEHLMSTANDDDDDDDDDDDNDDDDNDDDDGSASPAAAAAAVVCTQSLQVSVLCGFF